MGKDLKEMNSEATFIFVGRVFQTGRGVSQKPLGTMCSDESRGNVAGTAHARVIGSSTVSEVM